MLSAAMAGMRTPGYGRLSSKYVKIRRCGYDRHRSKRGKPPSEDQHNSQTGAAARRVRPNDPRLQDRSNQAGGKGELIKVIEPPKLKEFSAHWQTKIEAEVKPREQKKKGRQPKLDWDAMLPKIYQEWMGGKTLQELGRIYQISYVTLGQRLRDYKPEGIS